MKHLKFDINLHPDILPLLIDLFTNEKIGSGNQEKNKTLCQVS